MTREERDYSEYIKKYGVTELFQVNAFFEGVGFLLHKKLLDIDMAREMWGEPVLMMWEKNGFIFRQLHSDKAFWFEYLYNELKRGKQQQ